MSVINILNQCTLKYTPRKQIQESVENVLRGEKVNEIEINIVLCDDDFIHIINKQYLNHDYETDVISFKLEDEPIEGEIYISVDTAKIQANDYKVSLTNELKRLAVHGTLHIIGYDDASAEERLKMNELENKYIS